MTIRPRFQPGLLKNIAYFDDRSKNKLKSDQDRNIRYDNFFDFPNKNNNFATPLSPDKEQAENMNFRLYLGEMFTLKEYRK